MAASSSKKLLLLRKPLCRALKPNFSPSPSSSIIQRSFLSSSSSSTHNKYLLEPSVTISKSFLSELSRSYCSRSSPLPDASQGPAAIDYRSLLQEDEYHRLANATIHDLLEKLEEYGDSVDIDGFDVDYGNEVLTLKLGGLGTYVINKQAPNRQIWMSLPVSPQISIPCATSINSPFVNLETRLVHHVQYSITLQHAQEKESVMQSQH
ncbi:uncharacterized protein LOC107759791 isoform X1 [Nicotiana tabacum]|uniref:Uncharacterized protein LOC107759791 isoform X1 n=1 Tax=Nicotiana tabacum TaxID=4097 RepID=A0AC58T8E0_TOBAC